MFVYKEVWIAAIQMFVQPARAKFHTNKEENRDFPPYASKLRAVGYTATNYNVHELFHKF